MKRLVALLIGLILVALVSGAVCAHRYDIELPTANDGSELYEVFGPLSCNMDLPRALGLDAMISAQLSARDKTPFIPGYRRHRPVRSRIR